MHVVGHCHYRTRLSYNFLRHKRGIAGAGLGAGYRVAGFPYWPDRGRTEVVTMRRHVSLPVVGGLVERRVPRMQPSARFRNLRLQSGARSGLQHMVKSVIDGATIDGHDLAANEGCIFAGEKRYSAH